jgi:hypothetical protein
MRIWAATDSNLARQLRHAYVRDLIQRHLRTQVCTELCTDLSAPNGISEHRSGAKTPLQ